MRNQLRGLRFEALQQECSVHHERDAYGHQGVHEDVELRLSEPVLPEPLEDVRFGMQVPPVDVGEASSEVDDRGQMRHTPFPGVSGISHLHEGYVEVVGLAVDVLEFFRYYLALFGVVLV